MFFPQLKGIDNFKEKLDGTGNKKRSKSLTFVQCEGDINSLAGISVLFVGMDMLTKADF